MCLVNIQSIVVIAQCCWFCRYVVEAEPFWSIHLLHASGPTVHWFDHQLRLRDIFNRCMGVIFTRYVHQFKNSSGRGTHSQHCLPSTTKTVIGILFCGQITFSFQWYVCSVFSADSYTGWSRHIEFSHLYTYLKFLYGNCPQYTYYHLNWSILTNSIHKHLNHCTIMCYTEWKGTIMFIVAT